MQFVPLMILPFQAQRVKQLYSMGKNRFRNRQQRKINRTRNEANSFGSGLLAFIAWTFSFHRFIMSRKKMLVCSLPANGADSLYVIGLIEIWNVKHFVVLDFRVKIINQMLLYPNTKLFSRMSSEKLKCITTWELIIIYLFCPLPFLFANTSFSTIEIMCFKGLSKKYHSSYNSSVYLHCSQFRSLLNPWQ